MRSLKLIYVSTYGSWWWWWWWWPAYWYWYVWIDVDAGSPGSLAILLASSLSKMSASMATYPHEVIRTRLQNQSVKPFKYKGIFHAIKVIMAEESIRGFYKGLPTNLLRTVPSSAMTILTYEMLVRELNALKDRWLVIQPMYPQTHHQRHSSSNFISIHYSQLSPNPCCVSTHETIYHFPQYNAQHSHLQLSIHMVELIVRNLVKLTL